MGVFGCFGGTPEKERIQSLRTDSPAKSQKAHRSKRGFEKNPPAIIEQAFVTEDDMGRCIRSEEDFSDITIAVRPGGTSLSSCGSTNIPLKNAVAGVLAWAHVDELAEEVADLRRRLCEEEENAHRLAEEVVTLRSKGGDSGEGSQTCSERSNRSNQSRVHVVDPHLHSSQRDGLHSMDQVGLKKSSTNESTDELTDELTDDDRAQPLSEPDESEETGIRIPCLPAAMVPSDDMARDKGLPMLHTEHWQWEKMTRQGSPSRTSGGRKSLSPRQRKRAMRPPSSAPPGPRGKLSGNFQDRDAVFRAEVSQESASLRMGINGGSENSGDSNGSVGIQNLLEAGGSESSFALAPPISAPGAIDLVDSPTMEPKRHAQQLSLQTTLESKMAQGCAELDLNSTSHYTHMERDESLRQETSLSFHPAMPVDETAQEGNKEESCNPMASPTRREEVEVEAPWNPFPGRLYHNLSASQFPDSVNSPDFRDFISHTSPLFVNEDVDVRSVVTDSSSESRRLRVSHFPPQSELLCSPHTQDMLQVHLNDAEMSFGNPVYAYDV